MRKKKSLIIILFVLVATVGIIIVIYNTPLKNKIIDKEETSSNVSITKDIDGKKLNITYYEGNMIDEDISYGNKITKLIKVGNKNKELVSFAINLEESEISNDELKYQAYYSTDNENFEQLTEEKNVTEEMNLEYNLGIEKKSTLYFKIEFIAYSEDITKFKGVINVDSNLSEKDVFKTNLVKLQESLQEKIDSINGINESGYFIININDIKSKDQKDYKGYILIDASYYSSLKYIYTIYNSKLMLINEEYSEDIKKSKIKEYNADTIKSLTTTNICSKYTKNSCKAFNSLKKTENGGLTNFATFSNDVYNTAKNDFESKNKTKGIYIYNIREDLKYSKNNMRGFILVDNSKNTTEYYLYITNNIFLVSGYNVTKLGEVKTSTGTIRTYVASLFDRSAKDEKTVCTFTGFSNCIGM